MAKYDSTVDIVKGSSLSTDKIALNILAAEGAPSGEASTTYSRDPATVQIVE